MDLLRLLVFLFCDLMVFWILKVEDDVSLYA